MLEDYLYKSEDPKCVCYLHEKMIDGELEQLSFNDNCYDRCRWIYDFAMLRHEHYSLSWTFTLKHDLDEIALFSLLINKHDDRARKIIDMHVSDSKELDFSNVIEMVRMEWLPSASKDMCLHLLNSFPNSASVNYVVTSWSIMSEYDIKNLKYAYDHNIVYESVGKTPVDHEYAIKVGYYGSFVVFPTEDDMLSGDNNRIGDNNIRIGDKELFDRLWTNLSLDDICDRATRIAWNSPVGYKGIMLGWNKCNI
ncbi:hypothetical protein CONCODRAFT_3878 [Conidiobolus coronatus NRRL 28638]|uniref:Uncharacterized protein n=1 Tax=Conidiobolus coronatus (strain ATCC 28846 / CBS 209.66 / NRRL 28638) TaxID=796925 RepID=A0A137PDY6_CONC2|nr:hypothetical protein CONCODRAFT_3878 [Conidiobolus coronatus NRRL 28638]|eukprot:KXN73207.1 hypothetical protein CONCODRAFT_3878 [Conidiobolus coronatus NRRL 28638]